MHKSLDKSLLLLSLFAVSMAGLAAPTVYIPLGSANGIAVIDAESGTATASIPDVMNPHGLAITPDLKYLVAGAYTESKRGEAESPAKPPGVSETEHQQHHQATDAENRGSVGMSHVSLIDTATRAVIERIEVTGAVHHTAVTPGGHFAISTHPTTGVISVIDLQSRKVVNTIPTGPLPNYAVVTRDSKRIYVSNAGNNTVSEIDTERWIVIRNMQTGVAPEHLVISPDENTLYVNNIGDGTVSVIALDAEKTLKTYAVGNTPHGIDLSENGQTLFVSSKDDNQLLAIDLGSEEIRRLSLDPAPYHVTAVRGTGKLYVSSRSAAKLWVVDQETLELLDEITIDGIGHQMVVSAR